MPVWTYAESVNADRGHQVAVQVPPPPDSAQLQVSSGNGSRRPFTTVLVLATIVASCYFGVESTTDHNPTADLTLAVLLGVLAFTIIWLLASARSTTRPAEQQSPTSLPIPPAR